MGVYAQTNIIITCLDRKVAQLVVKKIKDLAKINKNDFNYGYENIDIDDNTVFLFKESGRIQNLEYQCEVLWEAIKNIQGVMVMDCPFLSEADGKYFSNE